MDEFYPIAMRDRTRGRLLARGLVVLSVLLIVTGIVLSALLDGGYLAGNLILVGGLSMVFGLVFHQVTERGRYAGR
jgi:hypothetical protein